MKPRVVVLLSGKGSNFRAIAEQVRHDALPIELVAVLSDRAEAGGLKLARELDLPAAHLSPQDFPNRAAFDAALSDRVGTFRPDLVVLAGYMRILSGSFVHRYLGKLVNIHPSLLPKYPGLHTHRRALSAGDREHGATVHFVTEDLDSGPIILQGRVPVLEGDTEETLSARVQQAEHKIYPQALRWFAEGRLELRDGQALFDGAASLPPIQDFRQ